MAKVNRMILRGVKDLGQDRVVYAVTFLNEENQQVEVEGVVISGTLPELEDGNALRKVGLGEDVAYVEGDLRLSGYPGEEVENPQGERVAVRFDIEPETTYNVTPASLNYAFKIVGDPGEHFGQLGATEGSVCFFGGSRYLVNDNPDGTVTTEGESRDLVTMISGMGVEIEEIGDCITFPITTEPFTVTKA